MQRVSHFSPSHHYAPSFCNTREHKNVRPLTLPWFGCIFPLKIIIMPHIKARKFKPQPRLEPVLPHWWQVVTRKGDVPTMTLPFAPQPFAFLACHQYDWCGFESRLGLEPSRFSMWHFLKLVARGFLLVLRFSPHFHRFMVQPIK